MRPSSRIDRKFAYPRPSSPRRFSAGTRASAKVSGCVSEEFHPTLSYAGSAVNPGVSAGTMIVEMAFFTEPSAARRSPVTAVTVTGPRARIHLSGAVKLVAEVTLGAVAPLGLVAGREVWASVKATEVTAYPA